jgi:acetyl esterase
MICKTYLERRKPVVVLVRWGKGDDPRNVLIQREEGTTVVRPFRGLKIAIKHVT